MRKKTNKKHAAAKAKEEQHNQAFETAMRARTLAMTSKISDLLKDLPTHERARVLRASAVLLGCDYGNGF